MISKTNAKIKAIINIGEKTIEDIGSTTKGSAKAKSVERKNAKKDIIKIINLFFIS